MSQRRSAPGSLPATDGRPKASARALAQVIERSSRLQGPVAEAYVARLRRAHPGASPAEVVAKLETLFGRVDGQWCCGGFGSDIPRGRDIDGDVCGRW